MAKKNKFNAKKVIIDGFIFDSQKEGRRYNVLKQLKKGSLAVDRVVRIELQPRYDIVVNEKKIGFYKADFRVTYSDGSIEIEDVKGLKKGSAYQLFRLKKKLVEAIYNIQIIEI